MKSTPCAFFIGPFKVYKQHLRRKLFKNYLLIHWNFGIIGNKAMPHFANGLTMLPYWNNRKLKVFNVMPVNMCPWVNIWNIGWAVFALKFSGVNFINILRTRFFVLKRIEHLFSNYVWLCNFLAPKKSHIKCWWNWHLDPGFLVHSGAKIIHWPVQLCNNYNVNYVWSYISAQMMGKQSSIFSAMCQICYISFLEVWISKIVLQLWKKAQLKQGTWVELSKPPMLINSWKCNQN